MQWIAAGDGINMNYRFSQPGRTERNRQDHLYVEGVFPFANVTTYDPITGKIGQPLRALHGDRDLSARDGDLLGQRVLGEGRLAAAHRSRRAASTCPTRRSRATTSSRAISTAPATATSKGSCQQFQNPLELGAGAARAVHRAGRVGDRRHAAAAQPGAEALATARWCRRCRSRRWASRASRASPTPVSRRRATCFDYGPNFYETGIATINPPVITPPYQDNPANGPIYPSFVPKTDRGRQRHRRRAAAST